MKNILRIGTFILVSSIFGQVGYAYNDTDCPLVEQYYTSGGEIRNDNAWNLLLNTTNAEIKKIIDEAYPKENIIQAIDNLRGYCCQTQTLKIDQGICDIDLKDGKWAQSRFLYDHIIDVGFRHLDGVEDTNYVYDNMAEPDAKAKEWREKINELAVVVEGAIPLQIVQEFEAAWYDPQEGGAGQSPVHIISVDRTQDLSVGLAKITGRERADMGLASKYYATCYIGLFLNPELSKNGSKRSSFLQCRTMANNRIAREADFVKVISLEQGAQLMAKNLSVYSSQYFVQQGLMRLLDKAGKLGSNFNYLQQKAQGTAQCSMG